MTTPTIFDTTGADQSVLAHMAWLASNEIQQNKQVEIIGPQAQYVANMAGLSINGNFAVDNSPTLTDNLESTDPTGIIKAVKDTVNGAAQTGASIAHPIDTITKNLGNYAMMATGVVLVIGALLISQRKNITKIVKTGGEIAAIAA